MKQFFLILFCLFSIEIFAQKSMLSDTLFIKKVESSIDSIYDYKFDNSEEVYSELLRKFPNHPFPDLFYSTMLYWKYFPITPQSTHEALYIEKLNSSISKAEKMLEENENDPEAIFFHLMSRMMIMQYYADNSMSSKVITHIGPAYRMVKKGFDLVNNFADFNFSTGVYNYYREYYPKKHPAYKPVAYFLPEGNAKKGLQQLEFNWHNGVFLHSESLFFLTYINLYFEEDYRKAHKYAKQLEKEFPNNLLYVSYDIQTLLLLNKYNKAKALIPQLENMPHENDFFRIVAEIYEGIISEKKDKDFKKADQCYSDALIKLKKYGEFANMYSSIAYFGLSRIYSIKDEKRSKKYKKQALELSSYPHINFN